MGDGARDGGGREGVINSSVTSPLSADSYVERAPSRHYDKLYSYCCSDLPGWQINAKHKHGKLLLLIPSNWSVNMWGGK